MLEGEALPTGPPGNPGELSRERAGMGSEAQVCVLFRLLLNCGSFVVSVSPVQVEDSYQTGSQLASGKILAGQGQRQADDKCPAFSHAIPHREGRHRRQRSREIINQTNKPREQAL